MDYSSITHRLSRTSLISFIYCVHQQEFGYDTVFRGMQKIIAHNKKYLDPDIGVAYEDSGGFDIIGGNCPSSSILKFINCYSHALTEFGSNFDRIFTLDIPFFINEPNKCTVNHIYEFNKLSLTATIKAIEKDETLRDKIMFINQWKMPKQHMVWNKLYDELEIYKFMNHSSTGGLVGIAGATGIGFTPFIGEIFQSLARHIKHHRDQPLFNHHILGVYQLSGRFTIILLESIFASLDEVQECKVTYDSINFMKSSTLKLRSEDHKYFRLCDNGEFVFYKNIFELPESELSNVYNDAELPFITAQVNTIKDNSGKLDDVGCMVPLYSYSQLQIDELFHLLVVQYDMVAIFKTATNARTLRNQFNAILNSIHAKYAKVLGARFTKKLLLNIQLCYAFYSAWYVNDRTDEKIEDLMTKFISKVNFPCDLT